MVAYGFDIVKARMMVDENPKGFLKTTGSIYSQFGLKGFTRGLTPCLIRAFPANAAAFFGFEVTMSALNNL
jgi:solute carrier family 25 carnitine/acylcarnitine transporter 20/29